jgi:hypothetical protein
MVAYLKKQSVCVIVWVHDGPRVLRAWKFQLVKVDGKMFCIISGTIIGQFLEVLLLWMTKMVK